MITCWLRHKRGRVDFPASGGPERITLEQTCKSLFFVSTQRGDRVHEYDDFYHVQKAHVKNCGRQVKPAANDCFTFQCCKAELGHSVVDISKP